MACLPGLVATVASICPLPGTVWHTPTRAFIASPAAQMTGDCDCDPPDSSLPKCSVSFVDYATGDDTMLEAHTPHQCARCLGDCFGTGTVGVAQIEACVASFLGAGLFICPPCTSIADVQTVVTEFLTVCAP